MQHRIKSFIQHEVAGGVFLILATAGALVCANTGWDKSYQHLLHAMVQIGVSVNHDLWGLQEPLHVWINDGLMALFFLLLGLEIKRALLVGELSRTAQRLQPLFAVILGMSLPILVFVACNASNHDLLKGWAIPCATDTAFVLGVLTLVGRRVPPAIKILLTAIAVLDDLAAILIIAFFYTDSLNWTYLYFAGAGVLSLILLNRMHFGRLSWYVLSGLVVWLGFFKAGIHPTLAGAITAFAIPLTTDKGDSLALKLEHILHPWIVYFILPLFAFANAGLDFRNLTLADLGHSLPLGILLGLSVGKPAGIFAGLAIGHATGLAKKPHALLWRHYGGMALLCGMGFTLPLFVGDVAFNDAKIIEQIKLGVLSACLVSAVIGWTSCRLAFSTAPRKGP